MKYWWRDMSSVRNAHWENCEVQKIAQLFRGISYKKENASKKLKPGYKPILRANNINGEINFDELVYVPNELIQDEQKIRRGDIVFSMSSGSKHLVGKSAQAKSDFEGSFGAFCGLLRPSKLICGRFISYVFQDRTFRKLISEIAKGTNINNLKREHILKYSFQLPPIEEQNRIVAKLEELFSELDKGIESFKTAREQLRVYRQAVLNYAVQSGARGNANYRPLSDLIGQIQQGWSPKCDLNRAPTLEEWAIIKTTVVQPMKYQSDKCKPFPSALDPRPELEVQVGDLLMTRKGPRLRTGVVCLVRSTRKRSMLCDTVYRFRCDETIVIPEYLELALNAPSVVSEIDTKKSGISDSGISLNHSKIKSIQIAVPEDIEQQQEIAKYVSEQFSVIENFESEIDRQLINAEALRQSLLKKAFEGRLIPQDPNDEPASVLLERIKTEKAELEKKTRKEKKVAV